MIRHMRSIAVVLVCTAAFLIGGACFGALADFAAPTRVLLVGCEHFSEQPSLAPVTSGNIEMLAKTFERAGVQQIDTAINTVATAEQLNYAIASAFSGAGMGDLNILYIATHGEYNPAKPHKPATLTFSDGLADTEVTAEQLQAMLDNVGGKKMLIIDACFSGAMIEKGMPAVLRGTKPVPFQRSDYMALTSSGGHELSWVWSGEDTSGSMLIGNSYFADALASGLGYQGQYPSDTNRDGTLLFSELYGYLYKQVASSTVQVYPQQSDYVLLTYDRGVKAVHQPTLSNFSFSDDLLTEEEPTIEFSFTAHTATRIQYQLVYRKMGLWDWPNAYVFMDSAESPADAAANGGTVSAGRKERSLAIADIEEELSGYALLQVIALEADGPHIYTNKLIALRPPQGDPDLSIEPLPASFLPAEGAELAVQVSHAFPLHLTVRMLDQSGKTVAKLAERQLSHPLTLRPDGSLFYWSGRNQDGSSCPPGRYIVDVTAQVGNTRYSAQADFWLALE